jgi:hypothetical protein
MKKQIITYRFNIPASATEAGMAAVINDKNAMA